MSCPFLWASSNNFIDFSLPAVIGITTVSYTHLDVYKRQEKDLFQIGTIAKIIKVIKLPDGNVSAITRGIQRLKVKNFVKSNSYFTAEIEKLKDSSTKKKEEYEALIDNIKDLAIKIIAVSYTHLDVYKRQS